MLPLELRLEAEWLMRAMRPRFDFNASGLCWRAARGVTSRRQPKRNISTQNVATLSRYARRKGHSLR